MRIDHHAYQRATRVAGLGFLVQLGIGLTLLIFSLVGDPSPQDTATLFGSLYILLGLIVWLGLIIIFNQHKLERLEALEEDEIEAASGGAGSMFTGEDDAVRLAARRLRLMYRWFMPILSLLLAAGLGLVASLMLRHMSAVKSDEAVFALTEHVGWAVAICLAFAAVSFIVSRFVAGMAKLTAWQNLRGGAAFMVGNALVTVAIAVGVGFRFFENDEIVRFIAYAIPIFMGLQAVEIILNFVLNLYRPRVMGETPRPAFDSKFLSLFAAPDNLVRSINEQVNYQFGFDVTSSWGYQLLLRSFVWLVGLGGAVLIVLSMIVIVEPHEQAVKLSRGSMVGDVHSSGIMWKLPWPLETAEVHDVARIRQLHITGKQLAPAMVQLWSDDIGPKYDTELVPFIVRPPARGAADDDGSELATGSGSISESISLVDVEIVLEFFIREDGGLLDYLAFSPQISGRRQKLTTQELALKSLALREVGQELSRLTIDEVLTNRRSELAEGLRRRIQDAFDRSRTGVELVAVNLPLIRPAGDAAKTFENFSMSYSGRMQTIAVAEQSVLEGMTQLLGDASEVDLVIAELDEWEDLRREHGLDAEETLAQRAKVERLLVESGGMAAQTLAEAERDRWVRLMNARGRASRLKGQLLSYRAAPRFYRERETMIVFSRTLPGLYKYVVGIDPSRTNFDIELKAPNTMFNFSDAIEKDAEMMNK